MHGNEATNIVFPTVTLTIAFAQMAGIGTAANFNIYMGKNEKEEAKRYIGTGITFMGILGIFIMLIVFLFKRQILLICGATEASMPLAMSYLTITNIGLPFFLFSNGGCHMIRADGSPMYSMLCNVSGALLNVFLDALFMYGFGWGIQGAALATVTGQIFSFILCVAYFPRMKSFRFSIQMLGIRTPLPDSDYEAGAVQLYQSNYNDDSQYHIKQYAENIWRRFCLWRGYSSGCFGCCSKT